MFNVANISINAIQENKILAKVSEFTVDVHVDEEDSGQHLDLHFCWIHQHGPLLDALEPRYAISNNVTF